MNKQEWQLYLIFFILYSSSQFPPTLLFASAASRVRHPLVWVGDSGLLLLRDGSINSLAQFQVVSFPKGAKSLLNNPLPILRCFCLELRPRLQDGPVQYLSALYYRPIYCLFHLPILIHGRGGYFLLNGPQSPPPRPSRRLQQGALKPWNFAHRRRFPPPPGTSSCDRFPWRTSRLTWCPSSCAAPIRP